MRKLSAFEKVRGKNIYCVQFENYGYSQNAMGYFDTENLKELFKSVDPRALSIGVCIAPMTADQKRKACKGEAVRPTIETLQENSACLLFYKTKDIEHLVAILNACKYMLRKKIRKQKVEEYRKKYWGKIVQFEDLLKKQEEGSMI